MNAQLDLNFKSLLPVLCSDYMGWSECPITFMDEAMTLCWKSLGEEFQEVYASSHASAHQERE